MKHIPFKSFACPLDGLPLQIQGNSMVCSSNHCFDFDRKGTLNLLPVQFRKSKNPGDSKEMVEARQKFLDAGFYQLISDKLNELVDDVSVIFDAGCGEGYYTDRLACHLGDNAAIVGMDISKPAIIAAAKRNKNISWIVGTNANIPLLNNSVDCVVSLFAFPVWHEFRRILKPKGKVIIAEAGPDHLIELRRMLYPEIKEKTTERIIPETFSELQQEQLKIAISPPSPELLEAQIMMTPHGFRATKEKIEEAIHFSYEKMTLDILFSVYGVTVST